MGAARPSMKYRSWCDQAIEARPLDRPAEAGLPWKALTCRRLRPDPVRQIRPTSWSLPVSQPTVLRLPELPALARPMALALLAPLRQVPVPESRRMVPTRPEFRRTALAPLVFLPRVLALPLRPLALPVSRRVLAPRPSALEQPLVPPRAPPPQATAPDCRSSCAGRR